VLLLLCVWRGLVFRTQGDADEFEIPNNGIGMCLGAGMDCWVDSLNLSKVWVEVVSFILEVQVVYLGRWLF
jgi:hypothetical protein